MKLPNYLELLQKYFSYLLHLVPILTVFILLFVNFTTETKIDSQQVIDQWKMARNIYYLVVVLSIVVWAFITFLGTVFSDRGNVDEKVNEGGLGTIFTNSVLGLVFMTFSYTIAFMIVNLVKNIIN